MARVTNALVTWDDLALMSIATKSTPPTGLGIANKLEINTYYYVDNAASPFSGYTNDRCPPYQTIIGVFGGTVSWAPTICNACNAPSGTVVVAGNAATFCASTSFTSSTFASWTSGNYVLAYGGNALNISTTFGSQTATMYGGGCQACPNTTPVWTATGTTACVSCVATAVYRDTNSCSATYGYYKIGTGGTPQVSNPTSACNTSIIWGTTTGNTYSCSGGTVYTWIIEWDTNPCSSSYHTVWRSNGTTYYSNPAQSYPNTAENWVSNGAAYCTTNCVAYQPQINNNPCSSTYGQTRNYYLGSAAPCNYNATYTSNVGTLYTCSSGNVYSYTVYQNTNSCFTGNQYYATNGSTYSSNPSNSAPSTAQTWTQSGANYCSGTTLYQPQTQTNPCATNYGGTRDYAIESPSNTCAEVYVIVDCLTSGTGQSIVYAKNTFAVGDRVTSSGVTYRIDSVTTVGSAGSYVLSATGSTGCPEFTQFYDLCTGSYYYITTTGLSGKGYSSDTGTCLQVTGTTSSPTGSQIYNWYSDPSCECV